MASRRALEHLELPRPNVSREGRSATVDGAMAAIKNGDRVYVSPVCAVPTTLVQAMANQRDRWSSLELVTDYLIEPIPPFDHPGEPFHLTSLQPTAAVAPMREAGALSTIAASYSQYVSLLRPGGPQAIDVALVQVSPPGPEGRFSLGVGAGVSLELLRTAPLVIAEVNPQMPYTFGAGEIDRTEIDLLVEVDHPLIELEVPEPTETTKIIGTNAAGEIGDGAVLQFGIGAIPESILGALSERKNLGLHGGMVGDTVIDLVDAGALTGRAKNVDRGLMVVTGVLGTRRSFEWADRNPQIYTVPSSYSHGAVALARIENFVAINSALAVAADGSVNAETIGDRVVSGPGGQPEFVHGASVSPSGRSIIALPSTALGGTRSRLVGRLPADAVVTVPRYLIDTVVTEYGVARLRGVPLEDRPATLAAIAHPEHRKALVS